MITRVHGQVSDKQAKRNIKHIKHFEQLLLDSGVKEMKLSNPNPRPELVPLLPGLYKERDKKASETFQG